MLITTKKMLDLFQKGNYIRSFEDIESLNGYLRDIVKYELTGNDSWDAKMMSDRNYTVIESEHLVFA